MTINDLLEGGAILQDLGRVYSTDGEGNETAHFKPDTSETLYAPCNEGWASREIAYMFQFRGQIWIEVR